MKRQTGPIDEALGALVRDLRKERKMTQGDLAKRLGLSIQQVQKYENARNRIPLNFLVEIARILDVNTHYFLDRADVMGVMHLSDVSQNQKEIEAHTKELKRLFSLFERCSAGDRKKILQLAEKLAS